MYGVDHLEEYPVLVTAPPRLPIGLPSAVPYNGRKSPYDFVPRHSTCPALPGSPTPGPGLGKEKRTMKRASTACTECRRRGTKCHSGNPCLDCTAHDRLGYFDKLSDKRRKICEKKTHEDLTYYREFVSKLLEAIRVCDYADVHQLINTIQSGLSIEGIRDTMSHLLNQNRPPQSVL